MFTGVSSLVRPATAYSWASPPHRGAWGCSVCHSPGRNREQTEVPHSRVFCLAGSHTWCRMHRPCKRRVGEPAGGPARGPAGDGDGAISPVPAGSASSSPLEALEACLKGIPLSGSLPPQPPATSWFRSPQPGDPGSQRPELQPRGSHGQGSLGRGLRGAFMPATAQGGNRSCPPCPGPRSSRLSPHPSRQPPFCAASKQLPGWVGARWTLPARCLVEALMSSLQPLRTNGQRMLTRCGFLISSLSCRPGEETPVGGPLGPGYVQWLFP